MRFLELGITRSSDYRITSVNSLGMVAGVRGSLADTSAPQGVYWKDDTLREVAERLTRALGQLDHGSAEIRQINERGDILCLLFSKAGLEGSALLRAGEEAVVLGHARATLWAEDLNNHGQVVGAILEEGRDPVAFVWQDHVLRRLGPGIGKLVNDKGQVVIEDYATDTYSLWTDGQRTPIDLSVFPPDGSLHLSALNNRGQIAGTFQRRRPFASIPFFWDGSTLVQLEYTGEALDLNDRGQVVGTLVTSKPGADPARFPLLWRAGVVTRLCGQQGEAQAISENGLIAGVVEEEGGRRPVIWSDRALETDPLSAKLLPSAQRAQRERQQELTEVVKR